MPTDSLAARFWRRVDKDGPTVANMDTPCWVWTGRRDVRGGYGVMRVDGHDRKAHRLVHRLAGREVPQDLCVCHHCDNRLCVRPDHHFIGTIGDNVADAKMKGRLNGINRGQRNGSARLTEASVLEIRRLSAAGYTRVRVASMFGVSSPLVTAIVQRRLWRHI